MNRRITGRFPLAVLCIVHGCVAGPYAAGAVAQRREDLEIVDCLLPSQVRRLGTMIYHPPRRPIHTTAFDCRVRGGEYVEFDRADMHTALKVWMEAAEAGDPEAQTTVAEIYERGVGGAPDYQAALQWYRKAADQKYGRALFDLGTLYEEGLGVPEDKVQALNLYRQAWGLPEDSLMYQSAARAQQDALRAELQQQINAKNTQLDLLQSQLEVLQRQLANPAADPARKPGADPKAEIEALKKWIAQLEAERAASNQRLAAMPQLRTAAAVALLPKIDTEAERRSLGKLNFGRYYALIIGNQHYETIESLQTPLNDAAQVARVLHDKYGFTVQVLKDASDVAMLKALNDLNEVLHAEDNLLIYYAGHGARLQTSFDVAGYWLPINSEPPPKDTFWVPNEQITAHLARLTAKRVLVVADSCYAGLLSADPSYLFPSGVTAYTTDYLAYKLPKRARLLISSGGDQPVLDSNGGPDSVFAGAFIAELEANDHILSTPELFGGIAKRVAALPPPRGAAAKPEFKSIKGAGHEMGDFFFYPKDVKL